MILGHRDRDWSRHLAATDFSFLKRRVEPESWYPMTLFERLGNAILDVVAHGELDAVRRWGRTTAAHLSLLYPTLLAPGDPVETVARFRVLRSTFFDFDALTITLLHDGDVELEVSYEMGMPAEEAASLQTLGFFEGLLELAGARDVRGEITRRSWQGAPKTVIVLGWK
jgi:hypothetical protein